MLFCSTTGVTQRFIGGRGTPLKHFGVPGHTLLVSREGENRTEAGILLGGFQCRGSLRQEIKVWEGEKVE